MTAPSNTILQRRVRGIRTPVPSGYMLGRVSDGDGEVELIPLSRVNQALGGSGGGGGGGGGTARSTRQLMAFRSILPNPAVLPLEPLYRMVVAFPITLLGIQPVGPKCSVAPTNNATMLWKRNGASIGHMDILAAATSGTSTITSGVNISFAPGDLFEIDPPNPMDATLAQLSWTVLFQQIG